MGRVGGSERLFSQNILKRNNRNFFKKNRVWLSIVKSLTWKIDPNKRKEKLWDSWLKIFVYNASCDELFHTVSRAFKEQARSSKLSLDLIKQSQKETAWHNINKSYSNAVNFQNVVCWAASFLARIAIVTSPQVLLHKAIAVPPTALKTRFPRKVQCTARYPEQTFCSYWRIRDQVFSCKCQTMEDVEGFVTWIIPCKF